MRRIILNSQLICVVLLAFVFIYFVFFSRLYGPNRCVNIFSRNVGNIKAEDQRMDIGEDIHDDEFLIPSDEELKTLNETKLTSIYWGYMNTIQARCGNVFRFGSYKDSGKEICVDRAFRPVKPCLVYSFGFNIGFRRDNCQLYASLAVAQTINNVSAVKTYCCT